MVQFTNFLIDNMEVNSIFIYENGKKNSKFLIFSNFRGDYLRLQQKYFIYKYPCRLTLSNMAFREFFIAINLYPNPFNIFLI